MLRVYEELTKQPFRTDKVGMSYYDDFLDPEELAYKQKAKNRTGEIVYMSPKEYFELDSKYIHPKSSVEDLKRQRERDTDTIEWMTNELQSGRQLNLPFINFADKGQEGLHRMLVVGNLYGWDKKFPVLIVRAYDQEKEDRYNAISNIKDLKYWMEQFNSDCDVEDIIWDVAKEHNYELTDSCLGAILDAFKEGCKKEGYDVITDIEEDVESDTIKVYVTNIQGLPVPDDYQVVFEGTLSDYFSGINDEEDEEDLYDRVTSNIDNIDMLLGDIDLDDELLI